MKTRFDENGRCNQCWAGWLCRDCQADAAARDRQRSKVIALAAAGHRENEIQRVMAANELESDEFFTAREKAINIINTNRI